MRFLVAILILWLLFFYNIERLSRPINISSSAYLFVPVIVLATVLIPRLRTIPLWAILIAPIPVFLGLKVLEGSPVWGRDLPLTVTEISSIVIATILARWVSMGVAEFESAVAHITIGQMGRLPEQFSTGQGEIYREVRRARNYQRPLALMAIGVEEESIQVALDRIVQEVQQAMMRQYVLSGVSKTLVDELEDYNIIAQSNHHFIVLMPEMTSEKLPDVILRLRRIVGEKVGVKLQIGTAAFPDDAITFDSLVEKAVAKMNAEPEAPRRTQDLQTGRVTV